jgi:hypothetical protein
MGTGYHVILFTFTVTFCSDNDYDAILIQFYFKGSSKTYQNQNQDENCSSIYNAAIYNEKRRLTLDGKWQSHPQIYQEYIKFENFFALFG